jgi:hypothetical protein
LLERKVEEERAFGVLGVLTSKAVLYVCNVEEGSEASVPEGDGRSEFGLTELAGSDPGIKGRDLAAEGMFEYGSRVGLWRVMRLFRERGVPLTVFGCALAHERTAPDSTGGNTR